MGKKFDLVVIGGGPGGYVAAIRASQMGMTAAIVEKSDMGGICLNWGCIPTKALLKSAEQMAFLNEADSWGFDFDKLNFDFQKIIKRSRSIAAENSRGVDFLMKKNNISVIKGVGVLTDTSSVIVNNSKGHKIDQLVA
ncbi:MAG: dihydrolipoyl dehydrogenase, partial [Bacteroidetes bacterium]